MCIRDSFGTPIKITVASLVSLLFIILTVGIITENGTPQTQVEMAKGEIGLIENLGSVLYSEYVLPFELSSILFISAMIGAVILSKKDKELLD